MLIEDVKSGDIDYLTMLYGDPVEAISQALKPMFVAGEGRKYACADLSAIEGVVTATLAGERWKIEAFETIARGEKYNGADDIYCATAAKILGRPVTKKENPGDRQKWGKVPELAFGYQGGVGAWRQFDKSNDLKDTEIDVIKNSWRAEHPATKELWRACQDAFLRAVKERETVETHGCVFRMRGDFMTIMLPSGRLLWYYRPEVKLDEAPWSTEDDPAYTYTVYYWTMSAGPGGSRRWMKVHTYGGKIVENIVQAIARDIMVLGMFAAEEHRLPVILTVHDEILTEPREDDVEATAALLVRLMCRRPAWFRNCPIAAEGWEGPRWKK